MDNDLERVRSLLLGQEYAELLELKNEYRNDQAFSEAVARVIAEAMSERNASDDQIAEVLAPIIDGAIANSIDQDPRKLAESLYPIMGPAIRKSISETLQQMLENFNQLLEQSLSPKSLRWRFDAWRTGRSYSELVLFNTLEYNVEQIFLIHRETSLLISHVYSDLAERKDPDMVSGMFSAIQDFIQDSFSTHEGDVLDTLKLGELSVVIQSGPGAILAAVVRGIVPEHMRAGLQQASESVHLMKRADLQEYSGNPDDFLDVEETLRQLLESKAKEDVESSRRFPVLAVLAILGILSVTSYFSYLEYQKLEMRASIVDSVDELPGVVVLSAENRNEAHVITALVDPLADDVTDLLVPSDPAFPPSLIEKYTYLSAEDLLVKRRVTLRLPPPAEVTYTVNAGVLQVAGLATVQWYKDAAPLLAGVTGVVSVDINELTLNDPIAERRLLTLNNIEGVRFAYEKQESDLNLSDERLGLLADWMQELIAAEKSADRFDIVGYTDEGGTRRINERISVERAQGLMNALESLGVPSHRMQAFGSFEYHEGEIPQAREARIYVIE